MGNKKIILKKNSLNRINEFGSNLVWFSKIYRYQIFYLFIVDKIL